MVFKHNKTLIKSSQLEQISVISCQSAAND